MKIGVLTYHWTCNFGANMQSYSVSKILESYGHEVYFINFVQEDLENFYLDRGVTKHQMQKHEDFVELNMRQTRLCRTEEELIELCDEIGFDKLIVGSDSLWRVLTDGETSDVRYPNPFWMSWTERLKVPVPMISVSISSMGSWYIRQDKHTRKSMVQDLGRFESLSVRDTWTRWMIKLMSGFKLNPIKSPDPVFGLPRVGFSELIDNELSELISKRKYILVSSYKQYFDESVWQVFKEKINEKGYDLIELPHPEGSSGIVVDETVNLPMSPSTWFTWLHHSSGYIGEKFHPIVVSLINSKPVIAIDNYTGTGLAKKGIYWQSKTYDLMRELGLLTHYYPINKVSEIKDISSILDKFPKANAEKRVKNFEERFISMIEQSIYEK